MSGVNQLLYFASKSVFFTFFSLGFFVLSYNFFFSRLELDELIQQSMIEFCEWIDQQV